MTGQQVLRVLCLDIEGGFGGSSRSLFESIRHMPAGSLSTEVWCRRTGPIQERYRDIGVACHITPDMPHVSSLPRLSRNLYAYGRYALRWGKTRAFRRKLAAAANGRFDLVHFNHSGLFLLARWLRRRTRTPLTMHIRTHLPPNVFSRWQHRTIARVTDDPVFISENEQARIALLAGRSVPGHVIYNIVAIPGVVEPYAAVAGDDRFKIAAISNYAWVRGTDRLVDIAAALAAMGRRDFLFIVAGNMGLTRSLPGALGRIGAAGGSLADYAEYHGVSDMFCFTGHVSCPEQILAAADVVLRPSRGDNPWGREVLEAMAMGKPVIATGHYDRFVNDRVTGLLFADYDETAIARAIADLAADRPALNRMAAAARDRIADLCNGPARAQDLLAVWQAAVNR